MTETQSPGKEERGKQRGAALLVVLLLVATLAFIALSITERTSLSASRSVNARVRHESLWLAFGAETLALVAVEAAWKSRNGVMSLDDPWISEPMNVPFESGGGARLFFRDATACFNVNSLVVDTSGSGAFGADSPTVAEFSRLARNIGLSSIEGEQLAFVIADWVDADTSRLPQGAEDEYYSVLPSPYRTGNQGLGSVSELRAMKGMTRELYGALKPYLCAPPVANPSVINVNMLTLSHAPILAALLGDEVTVAQAQEIIAARPPGGYAGASDFLESPAMTALELDNTPGDRFEVTSNYVRARAEIVYDTALFELTTDIAVTAQGNAAVLVRRFGAEE